MEEQPILEEIDDNTERLIRRISLWTSLLLTAAVVVWYYQANPRDSPEIIKMRMFFKERNMEVGKFINLDKDEQVAFAYKNKHPFYKKYIKASTVEQERIRSLIHISRDFTPNQYWFNLFFLFVMSFTTFWFIGLMIEACIVIMRRNSEARIKNYQKEKEASLASTQNESLED
tara:strand:- start:392 stop:910 length:519 start_codon:yes stop_codon:yes gene_type:complete